MLIEQIVNNQRKYFLNNVVFDNDLRIENLSKLRKSIIDNLDNLLVAFKKDFNKCEFNVLSTEVGIVIREIDYFIKNLNKLNKIKKVKTNLLNFPSKGYIIPEPYGVVLIVSPWNYPVQLTFMPLVASIAAGNTSVLKPSNYCPNVSKVIEKICKVFDKKYVAVVLGGREQNSELFLQKFDFAFFTGGTNVAKVLLENISKNLTPCCLELGGKSPCIVAEDCDLEKAAKRIVWGKYVNAGQTCVAPDYVLVHNKIKDQFIELVQKYIVKFYYEEGNLTEDFCNIINDKHIQRILGLIDPEKVVIGGNQIGAKICPTVLNNVTFEDKVMQEEIFGPIMPIIEYYDIRKVIDKLRTLEKPLALYYFGKSKAEAEFVFKNVSCGGGCVNDTIMHLTCDTLPFGGVGNSGMGRYHGKKSFELFSHFKSVLSKSTKMELNIKYPPYKNRKIKLIKMFFKIKNKKEKKHFD